MKINLLLGLILVLSVLSLASEVRGAHIYQTQPIPEMMITKDNSYLSGVFDLTLGDILIINFTIVEISTAFGYLEVEIVLPDGTVYPYPDTSGMSAGDNYLECWYIVPDVDEGDHRFRIKSKDINSGEYIKIKGLVGHYYNDPPEATFTNVNEGDIITGVYNFTWTPSDPDADDLWDGINFRWGWHSLSLWRGTSWYEINVTWYDLQDGAYNVSVVIDEYHSILEDILDNPRLRYLFDTKTIYLDNYYPEITILSPTVNQLNPSSLDFIVSEPDCTIQYYLNGSEVSEVDFDTLKDGLYTLKIKPTDRTGKSTSKAVDFIIKKGVPVVNFKSFIVDNRTFTFDYSVISERETNTSIYLNNVKRDDLISNPVITDLEDGMYNLTIVVNDTAENIAKSSIIFDINSTLLTTTTTEVLTETTWITETTWETQITVYNETSYITETVYETRVINVTETVTTTEIYWVTETLVINETTYITSYLTEKVYETEIVYETSIVEITKATTDFAVIPIIVLAFMGIILKRWKGGKKN